MTDANSFVTRAKDLANCGRDELEYLPREFSRLWVRDQNRLARILTWKGPGAWGLDAFEVEGLSTIPQFKNASQNSAGSGLDFNPNFRSSEMSLDYIEASQHRCPVVLIGWALFASPYSQLTMAKNVNDRGLFEDAYRAIKQRAGTNASKMEQKIIEERPNCWEDGEHMDG